MPAPVKLHRHQDGDDAVVRPLWLAPASGHLLTRRCGQEVADETAGAPRCVGGS